MSCSEDRTSCPWVSYSSLFVLCSPRACLSLFSQLRWLSNGKLKLLNDNKVHSKISLLFNRSVLLPVILLVPPQLVKERAVSWSFAGIQPLEIRQQEHKHASGSWYLGSWRGIEVYLILEVFFLIIPQQQQAQASHPVSSSNCSVTLPSLKNPFEGLFHLFLLSAMLLNSYLLLTFATL